jgi:thiamine pyrophosphokinase
VDDIDQPDTPAIVIAGGDPIDPSLIARLPPDAWTVAADSGLDLAYALGLAVDLVVGDMDSVSPGLLADARASGAEIELHPPDKDATDLELALDAAVQRGHSHVIVLGGHGGRIDHLLGNALLLARADQAATTIEWRIGSSTVVPVHPHRPATFAGSPGDTVSILPIGGDAIGVTTSGLRWALDNEQLVSGSTRGISNEMTTDRVTVLLSSGVALVVHERTR